MTSFYNALLTSCFFVLLIILSSFFFRIKVYLEERKHKVKKIQISRFITTELKSDSEASDSDLWSEKVEARVDNELIAKLKKSDSGNDSK